MLKNIIETVSDTEKQLRIQRVVLGLGYIGVQLENDHVGLSANIVHTRTTSCTVFQKAGTLVGSTVGDVLSLGLQSGLIPRAICLAAINALKNVDGCGGSEDVFDEVTVEAHDRVAMIGLIEPVVVMLKKKGCDISVFEHRSVDNPLVLDPKEREAKCKEADIVIVTATSIINDTFGEIVDSLGNPRDVILMGPSTPMIREIFEPTPITHLAGSRVTDPDKALQVIMEGGGTKALYRHNAMVKVHQEVR